MAAKKLPVVHVAVCGLTSSSFSGMSGQGAGKSCLCNRFVRPKRDDLCLNHSSIMTNSDFGSSVINNSHYLYWGEKKAALEDGTVAFQIIEHTEFVEDGNLQLYPFLKPYHKRCIQQKLVSGGKVQYLHPDQLAVPDEYTNVGRFPEKFIVDGYIICIDVSDDLHDPQSQQREFLGRLLPAILSVKKAHVVVAFTKFDDAKDASVQAAHEILSKCKRQLTVIEVSALEGVNVDVCFLVLAHLVDSKRPRTRIPTYSAAYAHLKERIRKNEESFQTVLTGRITDFSLSLKRAQSLLENEVEFLVLRELRGIKRVERLIKAQLNYLKEARVKIKMVDFLDHLRASLELFLQELSLSDTLDSCKERIRNHEKYLGYFVDKPDWRDDVEMLQKDRLKQVPFSILDEQEGAKVLQHHLDLKLTPLREEVACNVILTKLKNTPNLIPGSNMEDVLRELSLSDQLAAVSEKKALQIFKDWMMHVEQECVSDIKELLLEHPHLFTLSEEVALPTINDQLKDDSRYQRLALSEQHSGTRTSAIIKHIGIMKWPDKSPFAQSPILKPNALHGAPSQEQLSRRHGEQSDQTDNQSNQSNWTLNVDSQKFNLAVLGRTSENALTLRSDFMNHMSGSNSCEVHDKRYQIELAVYHDKISALHTHDFSPQGAVAVVNSKECLIWLEETLQSLWIPGDATPPPYQGLPLVILALDDSLPPSDVSSLTVPDNPFCRRAKQLANAVQSVLMIERPTVQPKRLVLTSVISPLLSSILDSVTSYDDFLSYDLQYKPNALNVAVFTLAGDPYTPRSILLPWLRHQAVCCDREGSSLFVNCALERQHSVVNLTFHSSLNILDVKKRIHAGFILVYSPHRQASFAIMKHLLSQLPQIPILIVAMMTAKSCDSHVTEEGQKLAQQHGAFFLASNSREWGIGYTCDFFTKCWYSRFTSWQTQNFNPRGKKDRPLPQPTPGAHSSDEVATSAPSPHHLSSETSRSQSPLRPHSMSGLLNPVDTPLSPPPLRSPPLINSRSLPRPQRDKAGGKLRKEQIYSDPVDIAMDNEQKKVTLQRRQERDHTLPRTSASSLTGVLSPSHAVMKHLQSQGDIIDNTYSDPKDIIKYPLNDSPPEVPLRSPSMSPPPPPDEGTEEQLYDTVLPNKTPKPASGVHSYDHLARQTSWKYDHLVENDREWGQGEPQHSTDDPSLPEYSTVPQRREEGIMYATVGPEKTGGRSSTPDYRGNAAPHNTPRTHTPNFDAPPAPPGPPEGQLYAVVDKSRKKNKAVTTLPVAVSDRQHAEEKKPIVPSPPTVARSNRSAYVEDHLYAVVNPTKKKVPPPVPAKSPRSPVPPAINGGGSPPEISRRSLERQRVPTKPLVGNGTGHIRHKSSDLSSLGAVVKAHSSEQLYPHHHLSSRSYHAINVGEDLYAMPLRKAKRPPVAPKPLPRRSPSPVAPPTSSHAMGSTKSLPRGKSFDLDDRVTRTSPSHLPARVCSPQQEKRRQFLHSPLPDKHWQHMLDPRMRTASDPFFNRRVIAAASRAESSEDVGRGEGVWSGIGDSYHEDVDAEPILPARRYSPTEMGLEEVPPPLPPRNYDWSDVEDNDEDLFQSEDELEEPSARISLDDQQAMYSSLRLYQRRNNSVSALKDLYAMVNQVAREQEATQKVSNQPPLVENEGNVYDTLESVIKQKEQLKRKTEVAAAMKHSSAAEAERQGQKSAPPANPHTALGTIRGTGAAVFTPKQLKLIKQQQKLLDKLQKKTEREADRRRKSDVRRKRREEGRRKWKKNKGAKESEQQRYFGSPLEKVVEDDGVPRFIKQCTKIIEGKGLTIEGMYRVSGKKDVCLALQDQYDIDSQLDVASLDLCETAISSTLKAFFKLLPEPLISNTVASAALDINADNLSEQKKKLESILLQLPAPNLSTLRYLMLHLHKVQQLQDVNKMSSTNLAIVFWPTLMRPPLSDLADPSKQLCWQLMMARLIERPDIVPEIC